MTEPFDDLGRTYERVRDFEAFRADQRIWWIYMRNAAIELASREDLPDLKAACDLVKAFPENLPNEARRWLELRAAVARVLG